MLYGMSIQGYDILDDILPRKGHVMKNPVRVKNIESGFRFRIGDDDETVYIAYAKTRKRRCGQGGGERLDNTIGCVRVKGGRECRHLLLDAIVQGVS